MPRISLVVPLYNEEDNVPRLHDAIVSALDPCKIDYELLLIDDGSRDGTYDRAVQCARSDSRLRVVKFRRNYGQTAAMAAGIDEAKGDIIVTMDGDLQNDPLDIPRLLALIEQGYDIAIGWRKKRQDEGGRVFVSKIANRIIARVMGVDVKDSGCSLKAFRAGLIKTIPMYNEMHRFLPALSRLSGAKLAQIEVNHHARLYGVSKYGFSRTYKVMLDIVTVRAILSYARRPLGWLAMPIGIALGLGLGAIAVTALTNTGDRIISFGIAVLLLSLGFFLTTWALVGQVFAIIEPNVSAYAALGADLSLRRSGYRKENAS